MLTGTVPKISLKLTISFELRGLFQSKDKCPKFIRHKKEKCGSQRGGEDQAKHKHCSPPGKAVVWINSRFNFPERTLGLNATQWNRKVSHGPKKAGFSVVKFCRFWRTYIQPTCHQPYWHMPSVQPCGSLPVWSTWLLRPQMWEQSKEKSFRGDWKQQTTLFRRCVPTRIFLTGAWSQLSSNFVVKEDEIQLEILV